MGTDHLYPLFIGHHLVCDGFLFSSLYQLSAPAHSYSECPARGITTNFVFVVIAIIGTTIAPWQLFFQQSCVADKRLRFADLKWARLDTFLGACFTVTVAGAMIIVGNVSHQHGLNYEDPAKMADAILPFTNGFVRNAILR